MRSFAFVIVTAIAIPASAHTHFNSQIKLPTDPSETTRNLVLADMTGDGLKELVGYTQDTGGFEISVASSGFPTTLLARFDTHGRSGWTDGFGPVAIDAVFVGRFTSTSKENFCFRSRTPPGYGAYARTYCFEMNGSSLVESVGSGTTVPVSWLAGQRMITGDFDGDGYDELLTYNGSDGGSVQMWEWNQRIGGAIYDGITGKIDFTAGNISGFSSPGGIIMYAGNFANQAGEGVRDDLLVYNVTTRAAWVYHARRDPTSGGTVFWVFAGPFTLTADDEEVSVADADGDGFEDLIAHDALYGNNRFVSLQPSSFLASLGWERPDSGNLPTYNAPNETHLYFAKMSRFPGEGGNTNTRDDVWLYNAPANRFERYDARWCAPGYGGCPSYGEMTYWGWFYESQPSLITTMQMSYYGLP